MVVLLVKLVHGNCRYGPSNRCRDYLEVVDVDTTNSRRLQKSLDKVVFNRVQLTHLNDDTAQNVRNTYQSITIKWEAYGDAVSQNLNLMDEEDFNRQMIVLQARGWKDILEVDFRYYEELGRRAVRIPVRSAERTDEYRGMHEMSEEGGVVDTNYPHVEGRERPMAPIHEENDRVDDGDSHIHEDNPSHPSDSPGKWLLDSLDSSSTSRPANQPWAKASPMSIFDTEPVEDNPSSIPHAVQPVAVNTTGVDPTRPSGSRDRALASPHTPSSSVGGFRIETSTPLWMARRDQPLFTAKSNPSASLGTDGGRGK
ncbi:hypothetical protein F4824DRAFT_493875 [Ustulina deusta]|nr:hypothetical protein F4824DRAFT_493875 [Ustulina deusta]